MVARREWRPRKIPRVQRFPWFAISCLLGGPSRSGGQSFWVSGSIRPMGVHYFRFTAENNRGRLPSCTKSRQEYIRRWWPYCKCIIHETCAALSTVCAPEEIEVPCGACSLLLQSCLLNVRFFLLGCHVNQPSWYIGFGVAQRKG